MLLYETGKLPPSVYGWGLSDRGDYLYFAMRTHVCARTHATVHAQGKARKGGLFKTKHSSICRDRWNSVTMALNQNFIFIISAQ